jgi:hypothetical protein
MPPEYFEEWWCDTSVWTVPILEPLLKEVVAAAAEMKTLRSTHHRLL